MKLLGKDVALYTRVGTWVQELGFSTSCDLQIACDMEEFTSVLSGVAKRFRPGRFSWTMSCDAVVETTSEAEIVLFQCITQRKAIVVSMNVQMPDSSEWLSISGNAYLTSYTLNGAVGSLATYKVSLQGDGDLNF